IGDFIIDPEDFGFSYCSPEELTGGAPDENAAIVLDILAGRETGPKRDIALLNAGAAIYIGGKGQDLGSAIGLARESVSSGAAMKKLEKLRQVTNG
ncbi:MAG TPA: anthranilate phosphoribosyltransferase, partial [Spirochaetia bacterium]|nr:anthranilate phosphoribosyltransferase [Spirochaetia bacterium]